MSKINYLAIALLLFSIGQAHGATEVELVNERTLDGEKQMFTIKALYDGRKSRYTFHRPDDKKVGNGSYLFSLDSGKTYHYIDTNENICRQWDSEELANTLSQFLLKTTDKYNVKASDLEIKIILVEPADAMHGLETRHIRIKINYTASYKYLLFKGHYRIEREVDLWVTPKRENIDPVLQKIWQYTGNDELDQKIQDIVGPEDVTYLLRSDIQQTRIDKKGEQSNMTMHQYIDSITEIDNLPDRTFVMPDCRNVDSKQMKKKFTELLKKLSS